MCRVANVHIQLSFCQHLLYIRILHVFLILQLSYFLNKATELKLGHILWKYNAYCMQLNVWGQKDLLFSKDAFNGTKVK